MKNILALGSFLILVFGFSRADTISDYYLDMTSMGKSEFPQIKGKSEYGGRDVYLVVGDIFSFIGEKTEVIFPIDALIISTNVTLQFNANSPRIQRGLRHVIPNTQIQAIENSFNKKGQLSEVTEGYVVELGESFSPRHICFLATDLKTGGLTTIRNGRSIWNLKVQVLE